jgi:hypothetical protein
MVDAQGFADHLQHLASELSTTTGIDGESSVDVESESSACVIFTTHLIVGNVCIPCLGVCRQGKLAKLEDASKQGGHLPKRVVVKAYSGEGSL